MKRMVYNTSKGRWCMIVAELSIIRRRIKERREQLKYSYQNLADLTHLSKSTLQRYETGNIGNLPLDKLEILAKALECSPSYLLGWDETLGDLVNDPNQKWAYIVHSIDSVRFIDGKIEYSYDGYVHVTSDLLNKEQAVSCLCVVSKDNSMSNTFPLGSKAIVDPHADIRDGDYVAVATSEGSVILRQYSIPAGGENAVLIAENGKVILANKSSIVGKVILRTDTKTFI